MIRLDFCYLGNAVLGRVLRSVIASMAKLGSLRTAMRIVYGFCLRECTQKVRWRMVLRAVEPNRL